MKICLQEKEIINIVTPTLILSLTSELTDAVTSFTKKVAVVLGGLPPEFL